jgi:hypothetical protein
MTNILDTWTGTGNGLLSVRLIEDPDFVICPWVISSHPTTVATGDGVMEGVSVRVGVSVMVGVRVIVGVTVLVGVREGVHVNCSVGVLVGVNVLVGVSVFVDVIVDVLVGVREGVSVQGAGVSVTAMEMLRRIVRALCPKIGSPLATERSINGTKRGMTGKKSPSILTTRRCLLSERISLVILVVSVTGGGFVTVPSARVPQIGVSVVPGPLS